MSLAIHGSQICSCISFAAISVGNANCREYSPARIAGLGRCSSKKAGNRNTHNHLWRQADGGRYAASDMGEFPKTKARAKILLVDDYEVVRSGLKNLLKGHEQWEVCGEAENGRDAIEKVAQLRPDLVFLDVTMPVMNGFEAAQEIRRRAPGTKIVIFTMHGSSRMAEEAKRAGADAYLAKTTPLEMIENTILDLLELGVPPTFGTLLRHERDLE